MKFHRGRAGRRLHPGRDDFSQFAQCNFILRHAVLFVENAHNVADHGLHAVRGGDGALPFGVVDDCVGYRPVGDKTLKSGERAAQSVNQVRGDGPQRGRLGRQRQFVVRA